MIYQTKEYQWKKISCAASVKLSKLSGVWSVVELGIVRPAVIPDKRNNDGKKKEFVLFELFLVFNLFLCYFN
ncbi:MAG: hypothetical protein A2418_02985 [Candidatus Brennerbacteria bacterium RIFOXYC1_FULL_41_11]|nr:MAG: hypothetical protein A2391_01565 [Candidatus Brennerbacteria bacterium RIFOXYB1_FULL_41_13]OGY39755.1 MAG: hypothetical protein A2418_02985 [Candidatus Brennerbacteria bacterium RIFOXYC1_FULL_41_11]